MSAHYLQATSLRMPALPSKRKVCQARQSATTPGPKQYRCRKCPDNPLLKDCPVHGRKRTGPSAKHRKPTRDEEHTLINLDDDPPPFRPPDNQVPSPPVNDISTNEDNIDPCLRGLRADGTRQHVSSETPEGNTGTPPQNSVNEATPTMQELERAGGDDSGWEDEDDEDDEDDNDPGTKRKGDAGSDGEGEGGAYGYIEGVMRGNHEFCPELNVIHTNFLIIMKTSHCRQVMELTLELEEKWEELDKAKKAAEEACAEADVHREESTRKDAVIASLMAQLNT
ncbi:hypothetical protein NP233_g11108 [Leucocoprinus birnbaumii]|uniref:Uncharacterized protein n=1 Tax=Leucocoprinus birnbaumii TaxID=56174 RepID=A0AAD5VH58_9AGAR|nr:hypothetical protein NP233_g11108 [Leucocoprinus birnbaumii]